MRQRDLCRRSGANRGADSGDHFHGNASGMTSLCLFAARHRLTLRELALSAPAGAAFGINMVLFFTALKITTVANATLIGALFRFQPFASLTALALLLVSFPSYLSFNWDFVILFLVLGGAAIYLQSTPRQ